VECQISEPPQCIVGVLALPERPDRCVGKITRDLLCEELLNPGAGKGCLWRGGSGPLRDLGRGLNRRSGREGEREDEALRRHECGDASPRAARTGPKGRGTLLRLFFVLLRSWVLS